MIIDSKGKLFGKVSIIDVLILAVVVAGVTGVWFKFFKANTVTPLIGKADNIMMQIYGEEAPDFALKGVKKGDVVVDFERGVTIGKVTEVRTDKAVSFVETADGQVVAGSKPGYVSFYVDAEGTGVINNVGAAAFGGVDYYIGRTVTVKVGNSIFQGRVYKIEKKG
ncbi:MAG: DUF4330 domain-containing protein [Bacillota bacterium]